MKSYNNIKFSIGVTMENKINQLIVWGKNLDVLYVEDDISLREEVSIFLSDIFHKVDLAKNGQEGFDKLIQERYDIVITDILMPIMNGIEMIEEIKKLCPEQAILVTSAHNEIEYLLKLIHLGVDNFITKPLQSEQIFQVLYKIVENITQKKELQKYKENLEQANQTLKRLTQVQSQTLDLTSSMLRAYQEALDKACIVSITDVNGVIKEVNDNFCKVTGYAREEIIGNKHSLIGHPLTAKELYTELWQTILAKKTWQGLIVNQTKSLQALYHYTTVVPILDNQGDIIEFVGVIQDLSELYQNNQQQAQCDINQAIVLKECEILKNIPFPTALIYDDFTFDVYNKSFEEVVIRHEKVDLLGRLIAKNLQLKDLVYFEEMEYFENIDAILTQWPYGGEITFKGTIKSVVGFQEVLVKISPYAEHLHMICIVKQEDFELCCQVQER